MASSSRTRWHTPRSLHDRIHRRVRMADFASEYPIHWVEEVHEDGSMAQAPGMGSRAVWKNHDCSFGAGLLLSSVDPYFAGQGTVDELHGAMAQILLQLEYDETLQWLWYPWDDASQLISRFAAARSDDHPFKRWWLKHRSERELSRMESGELRCFRSVVTLNCRPGQGGQARDPYGVGPGPLERFSGISRILETSSILKQSFDMLDRAQYEEMARHVTKRIGAMQRLVSGRAGMFKAKPWRAADLFDYLRRIWNPDQWRNDRRARGGAHSIPRMDARWAPFAAYFLPMSSTVEDCGSEFRVGDYWHRILTMNTLPAELDFGYRPAALTLPSEVKGIKNMVVAMTARGVDKFVEMQKLRVRIRHLTGEMVGNPEHADNQKVIIKLNDRIAELREATRPQMFNIHLQVHLFEKDRELLREREHQVSSVLASRMEMSVGPEDYENLPFVLGFEQPGYAQYPDQSRFFSAMPLEVAALTPVSGYNDGCVPSDPALPVPLLWETDTGVPYGMHVFPGEDVVTNPGGMFIGVPGSGKTNLAQQFVLAAANRDMDVFIVDGAVQPGFQALCALLGGLYIVFDDSFRMNPLATKIVDGYQQNPTPEELTDILMTLNAMFQPAHPFTPLESSVMHSCVRFVFEQRSGDGTRVRFSEMRRAFDQARFTEDSQKALVAEWSIVLEETWLGRFGTIMSGTEDLPRSWFTVFDIRVLREKGMEQLQSVVVSSLFRHLARLSRENLKRVGAEKRWIWAFIDEAWKAVKNRTMLPQIIEGYRAGRAQALSMNLGSQSVEDVTRILQLDDTGEVVGEAESSPILNSCSHFFLFSMSDTDAAVAAKALMLNSAQCETLSHLGGEVGQYREFVHLLRCSDGERVFTKLRSRVTPEELWATTTSPQMVAARGEIEQQLRAGLASGIITRAALIRELAAAGWEIEAHVADTSLIQSVAICRMANQSKK